MGEIINWQGYTGELRLDCDIDCNVGATWYQSYFNNMRIDYTRQSQQHANLEDPGLIRGKISATKFQKSGYTPKFTMSNLNITHQLGYGTYSLVWMAEVKNLGKVALKQFNVTNVSAEMIWKERDMLIFLKHKGIINILGAFFDCDAFIALELCYGSLNAVMHQISRRNALRFGIQIAEALAWCHGKNIVHCDIKPNNILVTTSNNVVLSDFGQAVIIPHMTAVVKLPGSLGVAQYQDYECNKNFTYCTASDMFSFGCIFFELITRQFLMQYDISGVPISEYVIVSKQGRLKNLTSWPSKLKTRESLVERVTKHAGEFENVILGLIKNRKNRWTAAEFLTSAEIENGIRSNKISLQNLDNDTSDFVAKEQKWMELRTFKNQSMGEFDPMVAAYDSFYYDEFEVSGKSVERIALPSYEAYVLADFLKSTNSVTKFNEAIKRDDPVENAQLLSLINKWLGPSTQQMYCVNTAVLTGPKIMIHPSEQTSNLADSKAGKYDIYSSGENRNNVLALKSKECSKVYPKDTGPNAQDNVKFVDTTLDPRKPLSATKRISRPAIKVSSGNQSENLQPAQNQISNTANSIGVGRDSSSVIENRSGLTAKNNVPKPTQNQRLKGGSSKTHVNVYTASSQKSTTPKKPLLNKSKHEVESETSSASTPSTSSSDGYSD